MRVRPDRRVKGSLLSTAVGPLGGEVTVIHNCRLRGYMLHGSTSASQGASSEE